MKLAELWQRHSSRLELRGHNLRKRYERQLRRFLSFQKERSRRFDHIDEDLLGQFAARPNYHQDTAIALRHWFRFLHSQGVLLGAWQDEVPRPVFRPVRARFVPGHAQVLQFLSQHLSAEEPVDRLMRAVLEIAYGSGLRTGEIVALELADLRWGEGFLVVRKTKNRQQRSVPLTAWARHALERYLQEVRPLWRGEFSGNALWLHPTRGRPLRAQWLHDFLRSSRAGFTLHALRHACARRLLEGGAKVRDVQQLLGHACLRSTQIYTHLSTIWLQEMHRRYHPRALSPSLLSS